MTKKRIIKKAEKRFRTQVLAPLAIEKRKQDITIAKVSRQYGEDSEQYKAAVEKREEWKSQNRFKVTPLLRKVFLYNKRMRQKTLQKIMANNTVDVSMKEALAVHAAFVEDSTRYSVVL